MDRGGDGLNEGHEVPRGCVGRDGRGGMVVGRLHGLWWRARELGFLLWGWECQGYLLLLHVGVVREVREGVLCVPSVYRHGFAHVHECAIKV